MANASPKPDPGPPSPPGAIRQIRIGLAAPWRGAGFLLRHRQLWRPAVVPTIFGLTWSMLVLLKLLVGGGSGGWLMLAFAWLLNVAIVAGIFLAQVMIAVSSPLLDWLSEQAEEAVRGRPPGPPLWRLLLQASFWWRMLQILYEAIKLLAFKAVLGVVALLIGLTPGVGFLLALAISSFITGIDLLDYPLDRRRMPLRRKLQWFGRHWPKAFSFSAATLAWISIPGVGGLMLAPAVVGGTLIVLETEPNDRPGPEDAETGATPT